MLHGLRLMGGTFSAANVFRIDRAPWPSIVMRNIRRTVSACAAISTYFAASPLPSTRSQAGHERLITAPDSRARFRFSPHTSPIRRDLFLLSLCPRLISITARITSIESDLSV